jgi:hypothetical protein
MYNTRREAFFRHWVRLHSLDNEKMHNGGMSIQASAHVPSRAIRLFFLNSRYPVVLWHMSKYPTPRSRTIIEADPPKAHLSQTSRQVLLLEDVCPCLTSRLPLCSLSFLYPGYYGRPWRRFFRCLAHLLGYPTRRNFRWRLVSRLVVCFAFRYLCSAPSLDFTISTLWPRNVLRIQVLPSCHAPNLIDPRDNLIAAIHWSLPCAEHSAAYCPA